MHELIDAEFPAGDDAFHEIANRYYPYETSVAQDWQVSDSLLGHKGHAGFGGLPLSYQQLDSRVAVMQAAHHRLGNDATEAEPMSVLLFLVGTTFLATSVAMFLVFRPRKSGVHPWAQGQCWKRAFL